MPCQTSNPLQLQGGEEKRDAPCSTERAESVSSVTEWAYRDQMSCVNDVSVMWHDMVQPERADFYV